MRANTARTILCCTPVDDSHTSETGPSRFIEIGFYHCCDFPGLRRVEVEHIGDRNAEGFFAAVHAIRSQSANSVQSP